MSPEVVKCYTCYSFPSDMWALGAVVAYVTSRRHLFVNRCQVVSWSGGRCPVPTCYSPQLATIVMELLSPHAAPRPTAVAVKIKALRHLKCRISTPDESARIR